MNGDLVQNRIWRGDAQAARHLGDEYKFYRLPGVQAPGKRYDTGLKYGHAGNYRQPGEIDYDAGQDWGRGQYDFGDSSDLLRPTKWDKPGARWNLGGLYDQPTPDQAAATEFDAENQTLDDGQDWDQPGRFLTARSVSLNAEDMKYSRPNKYGKATWYALFDGTGITVSDYLIGPGGVFFIAAMQKLLPILAVECNRVISIYRPQQQSQMGLNEYGGTTAKNEKLLLQGRPCSILQGTKGEKSEANLPGDVRASWWTILLPNAGGTLRSDDIVVDDLNKRYILSSVELTDLGYRATAMQALS
jgi:hypothetical protein